MKDLTAFDIQQAFDGDTQVCQRSNGYELDVNKNLTESEVEGMMKSLGCVPYKSIPNAWIKGDTVIVIFYGSLSGFKKKGGVF
jgi:hypothetical protein